MKLSEWAARQGISYTTAWRWTKDDAMPVPWRKTPTGMILVDVEHDDAPTCVALYARVSSHDQRGDLDRHLARLSIYASGAGARSSQETVAKAIRTQSAQESS